MISQVKPSVQVTCSKVSRHRTDRNVAVAGEIVSDWVAEPRNEGRLSMVRVQDAFADQ